MGIKESLPYRNKRRGGNKNGKQVKISIKKRGAINVTNVSDLVYFFILFVIILN